MYTPLIPAFGRKRQVNLCEFNPAWSTEQAPEQAPGLQRNPVSGKTKSIKQTKENRRAGETGDAAMWIIRPVPSS